MNTENVSHRRRFWGACALTGVATLGLMALPLLPDGAAFGDSARFSLVCALAVLMAAGATVAIFSLKHL